MEELNTPMHRLPFDSQEGLARSQVYADYYMRERVGGNMGFDAQAVGVMACARLEWVLRDARADLAGIFSEQDIVYLLDCYQADVFYPEKFRGLPSGLCHHLGIELDEYEETDIAPLVDKLRALSAAQRVALADALEQTWYRGLPSGTPIDEFVAELGIELAPD